MSNHTRNKKTGRFSYEGNWKRLCVCGHELGSHTAEPPHVCGSYGTGEFDCECMKFKPVKKEG